MKKQIIRTNRFLGTPKKYPLRWGGLEPRTRKQMKEIYKLLIDLFSSAPILKEGYWDNDWKYYDRDTLYKLFREHFSHRGPHLITRYRFVRFLGKHVGLKPKNWIKRPGAMEYKINSEILREWKSKTN